jgi:hypothetical protein
MRLILLFLLLSRARAVCGPEPGGDREARETIESMVRAASLGLPKPAREAAAKGAAQAWLNKYEEAVEGTGRSSFGAAAAWGYCTEIAEPADHVRRIFLHVFHPPEGESITLPVAAARVKACRALTEGCAPIEFHAEGLERIVIPMPKTRDAIDTVIAVDVEG